MEKNDRVINLPAIEVDVNLNIVITRVTKLSRGNNKSANEKI